MSVLDSLYFRAPYPLRWLTVNAFGWMLARQRFGGQFTKTLQWMQESQYWTPEVMRAYQMERLRSVLTEAAAHVPYYRNIFRERGLTPDDFQCPEDLFKLPELSKDDIRRDPAALLNERRHAGTYVRQHSSGTTGQKLSYLLPKHLAFAIGAAVVWRTYGWAGIPMRASRVTLGGRWFTRRRPYWLVNHAENQLLMSIHHLTETTADEYIQRIRDFKPVFIQGHPTGIHFLARHLLSRRDRLQVQAISTTGETLEPFQRADIEEAFGTQVYECYGMSELVVMAQQCEHRRFHDMSEIGITEFIRDDATGLFRVVGTSLWNTAMPFIRYRIDDLVELETDPTCPCGRQLPVRIRRIIGRIDDAIQSADGATVFPVSIRMSINPLLKEHEAYQVQQIGPGRYVFLLAGQLDDLRVARIRQTLQAVLGQAASIEFANAEHIMTSGGKTRTVVNRGHNSPT